MLCANAVFAQSDSTVTLKTYRPARHYLGLSTGVGVSSFGIIVPLSLDYDVLFAKTNFGLSSSVFTRSAITPEYDLSSTGLAFGVIGFIPYSKNKENMSGLAIKPRVEAAFIKSTAHIRTAGQASDYPYKVVSIIDIDEITGASAALSLDIDSKFQVHKNVYISCGLNAQYGALGMNMAGRVTTENYLYNILVSRNTSAYNTHTSGAYFAAQLRIGAGLILRGKQPK